MLKAREERAGLQVDAQLAAFVENEALPGTNIAAEAFWSGLAGLVAGFAPLRRFSPAMLEHT